MTVSAQTPIDRSTGNGVTTVFPYGFKILAEEDLLVTVDGVDQELGVDYTVSGVGDDNGGNVTFISGAPADLSSVIRRRAMALVRETDFQDQGEMPAASVDDDLDRAVLMIQQVDEEIGRALTLPAGVTGVSAELPEPVASTFLGWNAAGNALENYIGLSEAPVSAAMAPVVSASTLAEARAELGARSSSDLITAAGGTADAITANFTPDITAWTNGLRFTLTGCLSNATTTPTLNPDGIGAKTIVNQGNLPLMIGDMPPQADLQYNSTYDAVVLLNPLEVTEAPVVTVSDNANARTFTLQPCVLLFGTTSLGSRTYVKRRVPAAISVTLSAGSTAGSQNAIQSDIAVIAIDNAGTVELAVNNLAGGVDLTETGLISTTAEGGAGGADSATSIYSTTARASVAYCVLSVIRSTQAVAGTWVTAATLIQSVFGQAFAAMHSIGFGQTWQNVIGSRANGTTYYNTTGKPIQVAICFWHTTGVGTVTVNGLQMGSNLGRTTYYNGQLISFIVPPGGSYSVALDNIFNWLELR